MSSPIIEVSNLSKRYQLGAIGATSLREEASRLYDRLRGIPHPDAQEFWALRDVSFEVKAGDVVGLLGRNGAGKSTLLKVLSRITEPTTGKAILRGRVASLLEVGTGFHPELTGRENIFLNGAILGMSRAEVRRKFDEIVAFAEVDQFIDTPVKRYSSGMYVRLAFAVAAHLEPEILIVDEVLAVGDAAFQRKCLGKMQDVARGQGRTVLFVSHNIATIRRLCTHGVYLSQGRSVGHGDIESVIALYENESGDGRIEPARFVQKPKSDRITVTAVSVTAGLGENGEFPAGAPLDLDITIESPIQLSGVTIGFTINDRAGNPILTSHHDDLAPRQIDITPGIQEHSARVDPNLLLPGRYTVTIGIVDRSWTLVALESECLKFEITTSQNQIAGHMVNRPGSILIPFHWRQR